MIKQHQDVTRECQRLQEEFNTLRSEKQDILSKYNLATEKVAKLELVSF